MDILPPDERRRDGKVERVRRGPSGSALLPFSAVRPVRFPGVTPLTGLLGPVASSGVQS